MINVTSVVTGTFSLSEAKSMTFPLVLFVAGIVVYAIFVFKFYNFLARRDIFKLNLQQYSESFFGAIAKLFSLIFYVIEYLIVTPLFIFFWFAIIAIVLSVLSKNHAVQQILLISMALVSAIRVTAYYREDLSRDLAKMMPFALLGVFLVDMTFFSYQDSMLTIKTIPLMWKQMIYYLSFSIVLEFLLRIFYALTLPFRKKS